MHTPLGNELSTKSHSSDTTTSRYDALPEAALAAIHAHEGPLLIDLDETLYLRNSTEDFIDCARPGLLALLLLRVFDVIKPWRLSGRDTRDNWRVCAIAILFPWTHPRWRAQAPCLAARYSNQQLKDALKAHPRQPIILTTGFRSIVTPLLAEMGFAGATIIAARMYCFADRRSGKLHMASGALGTETIDRCLAVTDFWPTLRCWSDVLGRSEPSGLKPAIAAPLAACICRASTSLRSNIRVNASSSATYCRRILPYGC